MEGGWVGRESGIKIAGASESRQGGWTRKWGDRPAVFLPDLTALIPSGTYGWWPFAIRVPRGSSVGSSALRVPRASHVHRCIVSICAVVLWLFACRVDLLLLVRLLDLLLLSRLLFACRVDLLLLLRLLLPLPPLRLGNSVPHVLRKNIEGGRERAGGRGGRAEGGRVT